MQKLTIPKSVTNVWCNLFALALAITTFLLCLNSFSTLSLIMICSAVYSLPVIFFEIWRHNFKVHAFKISYPDLIFQLLGLYATLLLVVLFYWLLPEYQKTLYTVYWEFLTYVGLAIVVLSIPYFVLMQKFNPEKDAYWILGKTLCFDHMQAFQEVTNAKKQLTQHFLAWIVKAFFLPVMFIFLQINVDYFLALNKDGFAFSLSDFFVLAVTIGFSLDLFIGMLGYLFTLKLFDTHIRSVDATLYGWVVCLICYQPFNKAIFDQYTTWVKSQTSWLTWITFEPLAYAWCVVSLILLGIYVLATITFGLRFSNLTHRGILTNGPYRFSKHPAYIAKNIFWWLTAVPFLAATPVLAIKGVLFLSVMSLIYYLRAKTEETHLSRDPVYVEYCLWMNEQGIFARLSKWLPFLKYQSPKGL